MQIGPDRCGSAGHDPKLSVVEEGFEPELSGAREIGDLICEQSSVISHLGLIFFLVLVVGANWFEGWLK